MILALATGLAVFAGTWGMAVFDNLADDSSLDDPGSESQRIGARITEDFGRQGADLVVLYSSADATVDDAPFRDAVVEATERIRGNPAVDEVTSYFDAPDAPQAQGLVSTDERATYLPIRLAPDASDADVERMIAELDAPGLTSQLGGQAAVDHEIDERVGDDIVRAELIAAPILLILLVIIFGSLVAAGMPLLVGVLAVLGACTVLRLLTLVTDISVFSINVITVLGLGLAVDYALFVVSRFREELDRGATPHEAVVRTMATAGRTVAVSGLIVSLSLAGLLIFPQLLLRSMGLGGSAAVLVAMLTSLTVLPALLAVLGHRIDALRLPWARRRTPAGVTAALASAASNAASDAGSNGGGAWGRVATSVMRRPVLYALGVTALLLALAIPFTRVQFGGIDERVLPEGTESRVVSERLVAEFDGDGLDPITVLVDGAPAAAAADHGRAIGDLARVERVEQVAQQGESTVFVVRPDTTDLDVARGIVQDIRALPAPSGADVLVGGEAANVVDQLGSLSQRLPWMLLLVVGITFVLMTIAFGSIVVPLKAIVMNVLSIAAAFGVVVWVFQDGNLSGVLGFTPTGFIEASQPILMIAILFGLSMDYEVFLLSRIRERYDDLGDNTAAVASGVQRTGGIITAAALLLCVVIGAFSTSGITFIKMIGVGMLVALVIDATLVRLLLVPATMRLLGRHNWYAPGFVRALYRRYGHREDDAPPMAPGATADEPPDRPAAGARRARRPPPGRRPRRRAAR